MKHTEINPQTEEIVKVLCKICKVITRHKVLTSVKYSGSESFTHYPEETYHWEDFFQTIQCQGCEDVTFRNLHSNSEDCDMDGPLVTQQLFPKRTTETLIEKDFLKTPYILKVIYKETINCYNENNRILCAAGTRALVEGICKENSILDGEVKVKDTSKNKRVNNLEGKINGLYEKGLLTKQNSEILHKLRFLGNTAIHELTRPKEEELKLAIEIVEHILDSIYEIKEKATKLKSKSH